jgi:predicted regulator of Ras-like GTPase activity (Roadblock/LC7/MglB family)
MIKKEEFTNTCKIEFEFLFKMLMKMEGAKAAALISRDGKIIDKISGEYSSEAVFPQMVDLALSSKSRMAMELNHGLFKGELGNFILMDCGSEYVLVILFDVLMKPTVIFSTYWQIINFIGQTFLDIISQN